MQSQMREEETSLLIGSGGNTTNMSMPDMTDTADGRRSVANEVADGAANDLDMSRIEALGGKVAGATTHLKNVAGSAIGTIVMAHAGPIDQIMDASQAVQDTAQQRMDMEEDGGRPKAAPQGPSATH